MKVIILSGGKGTRLPDSASDIPKALVKINGRPMIDHQIEFLERHGFCDLRFSLGFRARDIINHLNGKYEYVVEEEPLGTGGALKFASQDLEYPFMALNGDVITDLDLKAFIARYKKLKEVQNMIAVYEAEDARDFGLLKLEGDFILSFLEKPKDQRTGFINLGFYILDSRTLQEYPEKSFSIENDIFPNLARSKKLGYFLHRGYWTDAGTEERLRKVNRD